MEPVGGHADPFLLRDLVGIELRAPEALCGRVMTAIRQPVADTVGGADATAGRRRRVLRAVASSAIIAGVLAVGLEARHLKRVREAKAA